MMIFMQAATWADDIKHDKNYTPDIFDTSGERDFVCKDFFDASVHGLPAVRPTDQSTGYSEKTMHKNWHFIDAAFSTDDTPLPETPTPNAKTQIIEMRKVLASDASGRFEVLCSFLAAASVAILPTAARMHPRQQRKS